MMRRLVVAGWGKTNDIGSVSKVLRKATVTTAPDSNCTAIYGENFSSTTSVCANGRDGTSCQVSWNNFHLRKRCTNARFSDILFHCEEEVTSL